jgi:hypothetical protein
MKTNTDVIGEISTAYRNKGALAVGALLGGAPPAATYYVAHCEWSEWLSVPSLIILGGLVFSAETVVVWLASAFDSRRKALGVVILTELLMITATNKVVASTALAYLVAINAVATGCILARKRRAVGAAAPAKKRAPSRLRVVGTRSDSKGLGVGVPDRGARGTSSL